MAAEPLLSTSQAPAAWRTGLLIIWLILSYSAMYTG